MMNESTEREAGRPPVILPQESQTTPPTRAPAKPPGTDSPSALSDAYGAESLSSAPPEAPRPASQRSSKPISARQLAANRRNALKSTGPRTPAGKARSSRNAFKHGLRVSTRYPCLPEECAAALDTFRAELQSTLEPRNVLQRMLFPQIVSLAWRLIRMPEAQTKIFEYERARIPQPGQINAPDLLAHRCSEDARNGFLLLNRYERSIENALVRLLRVFHEAGGAESPSPEDRPCDELTQSHPTASTHFPASSLKNEH